MDRSSHSNTLAKSHVCFGFSSYSSYGIVSTWVSVPRPADLIQLFTIRPLVRLHRDLKEEKQPAYLTPRVLQVVICIV